ncbi:MAG: RNA polymerase sigma factor [Chloroflexi bacterium]|nr:RNA polymerase sigma factor [Chloroflexota bacterium]
MSTPRQNQQPDPATTDFDSLVEQHADLVYKVAYRIMGNAEDAEDVTQDAFLSAYRAWDSFRGQAKPTTWLYRITTNAALMKLRKGKTARSVTQTGLDNVHVVDGAPGPSSEAANSELREKLDAALDQLEPDLRAAVALRDIEGLSNIEAAEALGVTVAALKSRLHRARIRLRDLLADYVSASES